MKSLIGLRGRFGGPPGVTAASARTENAASRARREVGPGSRPGLAGGPGLLAAALAGGEI